MAALKAWLSVHIVIDLNIEPGRWLSARAAPPSEVSIKDEPRRVQARETIGSITIIALSLGSFFFHSIHLSGCLYLFLPILAILFFPALTLACIEKNR